MFGLLVYSNVFAASQKMYLDTEQKYIFTAENLTKTIPEFVEDEKKQIAMAETYEKIMNQETGAVSIADLFEVCRTGGFNTYRQAGYEQCRAFVLKLLENAEQEAEEGFLGGFCPAAYDENGKQQNGLKSIGDQTRIGDFCSSTNIAGGEVVFRKGYNCTCAAYACNPCCEVKGGACVTKVADGNGNCLRKEYNNVPNLSEPGAALKFCESKAVNGCKVVNGIKNFGGVKGRVVCNATQEELDGVRSRNTACPKSEWAENSENNTTAKCQSFCRAKAEQNSCKYITVLMKHSDKKCICNPGEHDYGSANMYKEVCGNDKGKTGKKEYCVTDYFNWTQTQIGQAIGFAQDYARIKHNNTIICSNSHRTSWNDDYIKCATKDASAYYEFKFDDVRESIDNDRRLTERSALCRLAGGRPNSIHDNYVCNGVSSSVCTNDLDKLAKKYGHGVEWKNDKCQFTGYGNETVSKDKFDKSLAKIEGLDNRAFFEIQVIAVRKNFVLEDDLEKYVRNKISGVNKFNCDPGYRTIKVADGILEKIVGNHDDIKRCYVDGKPIDFVFDDLSEIAGYERNRGESGAKCVGNAGKFDGHYCRGLTKSECFELEEKLLNELKRNGWSGDKDLVDWDEKAGACELNDAQFANNINKVGKYTAIVGLTITGAFTGGTTSALAIGLMATELAGIAGEIYTVRKKELLPQQWADEFLKASRSCKNASCAESTLRSNFGKIQQVQDMLNKDVLNDVDTELARLAELLPDSRFEEIMNSAEAPNCWQTWECQEKIFIGMQFASLAVGVGKGLIKLTKVISRKAGSAAAKQSTALAKVASKGDEAIDVAKGPKNPTGGAGGAGKGAETASGASKADDAASAVNGGAKPSGVGSGARVVDDVIYDADYFARNPSGVDNIFENADGVVQIKRQDMKAAILRDLMRKAEAYGFECSDCGGDILKFSKKVDNTADASRAASNATKGSSGAGRTAEKATGTGVGKAADNVADRVKINFDEIADNMKREIEAGKTDEVVILKDAYSESEWEVLKESLKKKGFETSTIPGNSSTYGMEQVVIRRVGSASHVADDAAKGASNANGVTRNVKNSEQFELVQKKALAYVKQPGGELYYPVERLDAAEWDALNKSIEHTGFKWENQGDGFMKFVRERPIKTGNDLVESLKSKNWLGVKKGGWYYTGVDGVSGGQHATGLKFHISVDAGDLDRATDIIGNAIRNSGIGGEFKVILNPEGFAWINQVGKEFTVYVSKEGYNSGKLQRFITECEEGLKNAGIKNNGFGKNVMGGDKAVEGSQYMHYRYDQLDDLGSPQGFYRSKYDFVAPNAANGGDIMDGIGVGKKVNKSANKVADVTKGATNVIETPIEEANKLFNIYGLSLGNMNGIEIPMSKFGNGEKTVNELARLVEKKGGYLQQVGDKIVVREPGKTGWDLRQSLKKHGIVSNRYASDTFHEIHIRSGDQCASGLKFHVSVNVEDLEIASYVIDDLVKRTDVADIWKVYSDGMTGSQKGKDFTIYVSKNGYNSDKIQGFLKELENELKDRNIRPNGYGNNIATGDKPVSGSSYMYYRYDRTNASGIPDGKYNSSYEFVAPNATYGGDIMRNISVM